MGLFSIIGKIAKAGLSAVTHGVSDKVLSLAKSVAGGKPKAAAVVKNAAPETVKDMALLNKAIETKPRVVRAMGAAEGWSYGKVGPNGNRKARPRRRAAFSMAELERRARAAPKGKTVRYSARGYETVATTDREALQNRPRATKAKRARSGPLNPAVARQAAIVKAAGAAYRAAGGSAGAGMSWKSFLANYRRAQQ